MSIEHDMENAAICTKALCPMQWDRISEDCNIKECPWRTEALRPELSANGLYYKCPQCGNVLFCYVDGFCSRCGKRITWSYVPLVHGDGGTTNVEEAVKKLRLESEEGKA